VETRPPGEVTSSVVGAEPFLTPANFAMRERQWLAAREAGCGNKRPWDQTSGAMDAWYVPRAALPEMARVLAAMANHTVWVHQVGTVPLSKTGRVHYKSFAGNSNGYGADAGVIRNGLGDHARRALLSRRPWCTQKRQSPWAC
jgi:hypothetical protein